MMDASSAGQGQLDLSMPKCKGHDVEEASVFQLAHLLDLGRITSVDLVGCYLQRITSLNGRLR